MIILSDGYKVSSKILISINKNIENIIELFLETCKGEEDNESLSYIYPEFLFRKNKVLCMDIIHELDEYTRDNYYHKLKPIQEYVLFYLLNWWVDIDGVEFDEVISDNDIKSEDDLHIASKVNDIKAYKDFLFDDWDFEDLNNFLELNPLFVEQFFNIDLSEYLYLMPDDKRKEYIDLKEQLNKRIIEDDDLEVFIVKQIYNALRLKENNPKRLMNTSETELSDDIRDIISNKLNDKNIIVERERPSGFSKVVIGECDFYMYSYKNGIYKTIAIGENKEWGNYEKQLKQLIGYMNSNTLFGFTILFNKTVKLETALKKRMYILKNISVINDNKKYFQVIGEIKEMDGMKNVLVTKHRNPEENTFFKIYHFIINSKLDERQESALQSRG
ncbi:hypothetical protein ACV3QT_12435 [Clostridium perfringens]|nr:hypothetical protein [Clostridium perfringens]